MVCEGQGRAWRVVGTRGSGTVLGMSVVRGMRVLVECVRCVCVWLGAPWEEIGVDERIGFGLYRSCENSGVLNVCHYLGNGVVGGGIGSGSGRVGCIMSVCVVGPDSLCV